MQNRVLPIIDDKQEIRDNPNSEDLKITNGNIKFKDVKFNYVKDNNQILNSINLDIPEKMTALVGHKWSWKIYNLKSNSSIL